MPPSKIAIPKSVVAIPASCTSGIADPNSAARYRPPKSLLRSINAFATIGGEKYCETRVSFHPDDTTWNPSWYSLFQTEIVARDATRSLVAGNVFCGRRGTIGNLSGTSQMRRPTPAKLSPAALRTRHRMFRNLSIKRGPQAFALGFVAEPLKRYRRLGI